jgi:DNA repair protein SbcC/Rad50
MARSPRSPPALADVEATLRSLLPQARIVVEGASLEDQLLILQTRHVVAAFGFATTDISSAYERSYSAFRKLYTERRSQWERLDLVFVLCVRADLPHLTRFSSDLETDVYFCRKFVIPLSADSPLSHSLARLPFLPLADLDGPSLRPPSAQTFLQRRGVPAALAKDIVVPHQRGAVGIVTDCLSGVFGEPTELKPTEGPLVGTENLPLGGPIQIETLEIENFRAYRTRQTFEIGKAATVLYGPNGFGKTSFFDAIDFAATGGIGRLEPATEPRFRKLAAHLDSRPEDASVKLNFRSADQKHEVVRTVAGRKRPHLDGHKSDRKAVLAKLTGGRGATSADRIENFIDLFRATHLFSQENQELAKNFRNGCRLSSEVVSRLLAFEDYANAAHKAGEVCKVLKDDLSRLNGGIATLSKALAEDRTELNRLQRNIKDTTDVGALTSAIAALKKRLAALGFAADASNVDAAVLRGWRALLETQIANSASRVTRLSALAKDTIQVPLLQQEIADLQHRAIEREKELPTADQERNATVEAAQAAETQASTLRAQLAEAQVQLDATIWLREHKPEFTQLATTRNNLLQTIEQFEQGLVALRQQETEAKIAVDQGVEALNAAEQRLSGASQRASALEGMAGSLPSWQAGDARLLQINSTDSAITEHLATLREAEPSLGNALNAATSKLSALSRLIADTDRSQSDLRQLLSQLQGHVSDGICPLCGEDHGNRGELLARIQARLSLDVASEARNDLASARAEADALGRQLAANRETQDARRREATELADERQKLEQRVADYRNLALSLGLSTDSAELAKELEAAQEASRNAVEALSREVQGLRKFLEGRRVTFAQAQSALRDTSTRLAADKTSAERARRRSDQLRREATAKNRPIDTDDTVVSSGETAQRRKVDELRTEVSKADAEVTQRKRSVEAATRRLTGLNAELSDLRGKSQDRQRTRTAILARLIELQLPEDSTEDDLQAVIQREARIQEQLRTIQQTAANIEIGIDAATTAAALTRLNDKIKQTESELTEANIKHAVYSLWHGYFVQISDLVVSQQSEGISNFTKAYGPRTSVVQRRLRSVYGFDDIEVRSEGSEIIVRALRQGEYLAPTDYFSQSQQQTLLLGLFLTACTGQNWSSFSPIFLDDPVTHFDDLNTYALLDLTVGFLGSDLNRRQFIISTCDDKLFQLAREKFSHLGNDALFYRFESIGETGPLVEKIALS